MSDSYQNVAVISFKVMEAILARLQWMIAPCETILCVGGDAAYMQTLLASHYQKARFLTEADMEPGAADWVIAHFALPYAPDPLTALLRWRAYLKPGGMLFCTHVGPDTLKEWDIASHHILPQRMDMHVLGDLLMHAGFKDPVLDVDYFYTRHRAIDKYLQELAMTHMIKTTASQEEIMNAENEWITTYEIVFAHAFSSESFFTADEDDTGTIVKIPVSEIRKISNPR